MSKFGCRKQSYRIEVKKLHCLVVKKEKCVTTCMYIPRTKCGAWFCWVFGQAPEGHSCMLPTVGITKDYARRTNLPAEIQLHFYVQNVHWNVFFPFLCKRHYTCNVSFQFNSYSPPPPSFPHILSFWTCFSTPIHPHLSLIPLPKYFFVRWRMFTGENLRLVSV